MCLVTKTSFFVSSCFCFTSCRFTPIYSLVVAPQSRVRVVATHLPSGETAFSRTSSLQRLQPESSARANTTIRNDPTFKSCLTLTDGIHCDNSRIRVLFEFGRQDHPRMEQTLVRFLLNPNASYLLLFVRQNPPS